MRGRFSYKGLYLGRQIGRFQTIEVCCRTLRYRATSDPELSHKLLNRLNTDVAILLQEVELEHLKHPTSRVYHFHAKSALLARTANRRVDLSKLSAPLPCETIAPGIEQSSSSKTCLAFGIASTVPVCHGERRNDVCDELQPSTLPGEWIDQVGGCRRCDYRPMLATESHMHDRRS